MTDNLQAYQEQLIQLCRVIDSKKEGITVTMDVWRFLLMIAGLQIVLALPSSKGERALRIWQVAEELIGILENEAPGIGGLLRMGFTDGEDIFPEKGEFPHEHN